MGRRRDAEELLPLVYDELRRLARALMARERPQTLPPTGLVHEAYLRLRKSHRRLWNDREHFFATAAEAMRRILVERARRTKRARHGGDLRRVPLSLANVEWETPPDELLDLNRALTRLERIDPRMAAVVNLRYFAGLKVTETSEALGISTRTTKRLWARARVWLFRELARPTRDPSGELSDDRVP